MKLLNRILVLVLVSKNKIKYNVEYNTRRLVCKNQLLFELQKSILTYERSRKDLFNDYVYGTEE